MNRHNSTSSIDDGMEPVSGGPDPSEVRDKPMMVSALSTFSMFMGLASILLLILVLPAIATALMAIVCGHLAAAIVRADGELLGIGRVRIGLLLGYGCLLVAAFLFPQMENGRLLVRGVMAADRSAAGKLADEFHDGVLGDREREVVANRENHAGHSPETEALAKSFRLRLIVVLKDVLELEDQKGLSWDPAGLRCHCYSKSGVVFMVRESGLLGFNDAALTMLNRASWRVALETVRDSGEFDAGFPIGVCVMGKRRSQTFIKGEAPNVDEELGEPAYSGADSANIVMFFE